jgi:hypothetical protein
MLKKALESGHLDVFSAPRRISDQIEDSCSARGSSAKYLVTGADRQLIR